MQFSWWSLFTTFARIGAFTIGGAYAMVPLIQAEVVDKHGWISARDFVDLLGVAQVIPGPLAVNVAVLTGYRLAGVPGILVATLGAVLPSFVAILAVVSLFHDVETNPLVVQAFRGIRPAVFGLVLAAAWRIGRVSMQNPVDLAGAVAALVLLVALRWHPIVVIAAGGVAGVLAVATARNEGEKAP